MKAEEIRKCFSTENILYAAGKSESDLMAIGVAVMTEIAAQLAEMNVILQSKGKRIDVRLIEWPGGTVLYNKIGERL